MGAQSQSDARNGAHSAYTLFADHPVPTLICEDGTLRVLAANISAVRHSGFSAAQLLTKSLQDLYPLDNRPEQWTEGARDASIAVHYRGEDGALASVRLTASRIEFDERPAWLIAITDISEQLRAEQALAESQKSERRFRQLFDTASDWFWEADAKGQLTYVSPNYEALYTLPIADVLGKRLQDGRCEDRPGYGGDVAPGHQGAATISRLHLFFSNRGYANEALGPHQRCPGL
jgi:PAS domain S-box-containing protein